MLLLLIVLCLRGSLLVLLLLLLLSLILLLSLLPLFILLWSLFDTFFSLRCVCSIILLLLLFLAIILLAFALVALAFLRVVVLEQQLLHAVDLAGLRGTRLAETACRGRRPFCRGLSLLRCRRWRQIRDSLRRFALRASGREIQLSVAVRDGHVAWRIQRCFDLSRRSCCSDVLVVVAHVRGARRQRVLSIDGCSGVMCRSSFRGRLHLLFELSILFGLKTHAQDIWHALLTGTQRLCAIEGGSCMLIAAAEKQAAKHRLVRQRKIRQSKPAR